MHVTFDLYWLEKEACTSVNRLRGQVQWHNRLNSYCPTCEKGNLGESTSLATIVDGPTQSSVKYYYVYMYTVYIYTIPLEQVFHVFSWPVTPAAEEIQQTGHTGNHCKYLFLWKLHVTNVQKAAWIAITLMWALPSTVLYSVVFFSIPLYASYMYGKGYTHSSS